jgi:PAS domain S-box-containing protein
MISSEGPQGDEQLRFASKLFDQANHAVITTDLAGTIAYWSRYAEELYGWSAAEVHGRNILDVTPTLANREDAAAIMALLQTGATWGGEFVVQRRDGSTFLAHVTDSPIFDEAGILIGIVGVSYAIATGR